MFKVLLTLVGFLAVAASAGADTTVDLAQFLRKDRFESIKISPNGEYYALTAPLADRTVLVVMRRSDKKLTAKVQGVANSVIHDFWWVNDERIVVSMAEKIGALETPMITGELHAVNADGSSDKRLTNATGAKDDDHGQVLSFGGGWQYVRMLNTLPKEDRHVLIVVSPYSVNPVSRIERLDVYTGAREVIASAPVGRASFILDTAGLVRFAVGYAGDNTQQVYYRADSENAWTKVFDEKVDGVRHTPFGFSVDGRQAYLEVEMPEGPNRIDVLDVMTGEKQSLLRHERVDPDFFLREPIEENPVGIGFVTDRLAVKYLDDASPMVRLHKILQSAFAEQSVRVTSSSKDFNWHIVWVSSDRNPGDFYLFNSKTNGAELIFSRSEWLNPGRMAATRRVTFKARDGVVIDGYFTVPTVASERKPALIVMPHGGPFGVFDTPAFDAEVQLLAAAGYAVLRPNFRGSGNYGKQFQHAGARQWGGSMQDDVTDATRWAIASGEIDASRICLYGASYGAYAALMGVAREPSLYRCAVGNVGVYDLEKMVDDDSDRAKWLGVWASEWVGEGDAFLQQRSPVNLAGQIKVPVFLAAGGEDPVAPVEHTERMESALLKAKVPVEVLYFKNEGHGFVKPENELKYYQRLLAFLSQHLGGALAK